MTYEVYCKDAGAVSCGGHVKAETEDEFKQKVVEHLKAKHGVDTPNDTLMDYLMSARREEGKASA